MNHFLRAFIVAAISSLPLSGRAQTDTTSTQDTSEKSLMAWSEVVLAQGKKVQGYFSLNEAGLEKRIYYCATNPEVKPHPETKFVNVDNIHSMTQRGRYSESLKIKGKSLHLLALRVVEGPVELFTFADPKSIPLPVPLPGATAVFAIPYINNHWYLRRNGELIEVRRGQFETQIADYVQDLPALAAKVRSKDKEYQYQDMIRIITEYNQQLMVTK